MGSIQSEYHNTLKGWQLTEVDIVKTTLELIDNPVNPNDLVTIQIPIIVDCDSILDETDATLFRYFYPLCERVYALFSAANRLKPEMQLNINIKSNSMEPEKTPAFFKCANFLQVIGILYKNILITINGNPLTARSYFRYGHLMPLLFVDNNYEGDKCYRRLSQTSINLIPEFKLVAKKMQSYYDNVINSQKTGAKVKKNAPSLYKESAALWDPDPDKLDIIAALESIALGNLCQTLANIHGSSVEGESFSSFEKKLLMQKLINFIKKNIANSPVLVQVIWSILLRYLMDQKEIAGSVGQINIVREDILAKSLLDATAYAEGLYQVIENACLHSPQHKAFFYFRVYSVDRNASVSELLDSAKTLSFLREKYKWIEKREKADAQRKTQEEDSIYLLYPFDKTIRHYLELVVVDDAFDAITRARKGLVETYNLQHGTPAKKISDIFGMQQNATNEIDDIIQHYGLALLQKITLCNKGCILIHSPGQEKQASWSEQYLKYGIDVSREGDGSIDDVPIAITAFNVLLPLTYKQDNSLQPQIPSGKVYFDTDIIHNGFYKIKKATILSSETPDICTPKDKLKVINDVYEHLKVQLDALENDIVWYNNLKIVYINLFNLDISQLEIFAKGLFKYIATITTAIVDENTTGKLLFAVHFSDNRLIYEFIRLYSIFYDVSGTQQYMRFTQIAVCGNSTAEEKKSSGEKYIPYVKLVLAGNNIESARNTAEQYAYFNPDSSMELIPQIQYLVRTVGAKEEVCEVPIFPFDLCLSLSDANCDAQAGVPTRSWFINHIECALRHDYREKAYGCKVSGIHIRLGSKIHLNEFYNAELLFHNIGTIQRFALIIAHEIYINHHSQQKKWLIVLGYEKYSDILTREVVRLLKHAGLAKVGSIIYAFAETAQEVIASPEMLKVMESCVDVIYYTLLPIGSTLSTVYKIQYAIKTKYEQFKEEAPKVYPNHAFYSFGTNICLIVTGKTMHSSDNRETLLYGKFWKNITLQNDQLGVAGTITLQPRETCPNDEYSVGLDVGFLIATESKWHSPRDCRKNDDNIKPLVYVDKTSTIPNSVFTLRGDGRKTIASVFLCTQTPKRYEGRCTHISPSENLLRIHQLNGFIRYSHIRRYNNHFQFFIDFPEYLAFISDSSETSNPVEMWLQKCAKELDRNAFNIIVSPLSEKNALFLKTVIDNAFNHCSRFFHMSLIDASKEDVRSKYSFVSEEIRRIRLQDPAMKIHTYFVDNSITSGYDLTRGKTLINMLLSDANVPIEDVDIYTGIFLLVNQKSYESIRSFTKTPETTFFAYIHLLIPPFNTNNDVCPFCKLAERYQLLRQCSATSVLSDEFERLEDKHTKRDLGQYDHWLDQHIRTNHEYLGWLKSQLYRHEDDAFLPFVKEDTVRKVRDFIQKQLEEHVLSICNELKSEGQPSNAGTPKDNNTDKPEEDRWMPALKDVIDDPECRIKLLKKISKTTLEELCSTPNPEESKEMLSACIEIAKNGIIAQRNFSRLECLHKAFQAVDGVYNAIEATCKILDLVIADCNAIKIKMEGQDIQRIKVAQLDRLISYIKVVSREPFTMQYHYREAAYDILKTLLSYFSDLKECHQDPKYESLIRIIREESTDKQDGAYPSSQYLTILTIMRRLADMQAPVILDSKLIEDILGAWQGVKDKYFGEGLYQQFYADLEGKYSLEKHMNFVLWNELPTDERIQFDYCKLVKWITSSTNDYSNCLEVEQNLIPQLCKDPDAKQNSNFKSNAKHRLMKNMANSIYIENNALLYHGMKQLLPTVALETSDGKDAYAKLVKQEYCKCLDKSSEASSGENPSLAYLYQNPLHDFFEFVDIAYENCYGAIHSDGNKRFYQLGSMIKFYKCILELAQADKSCNLQSRSLAVDWSYPYVYEELCNAVRDIAGADDCYIVYHKLTDTNICMQSSPRVIAEKSENKSIAKALDSYNMQYIINEIISSKTSESSSWQLTDSVFKFNPDTCKTEADAALLRSHTELTEKLGARFHILLLELKLQSDWSGRGSIFLVLPQSQEGQENETRWKNTDKEYLFQARNILCFKNKLQTLMERDLHVLLRFEKEYNYIKCNNVGGNRVYMHISDLHVNKKNAKSMVSAIQDINFDMLEIPREIDMLLITGDVIQTASAASELEANYNEAADVIKSIAIKLWEKNNHLPHDWQKRIIIIPGNHDYATMNELKSESEERHTTIGTPAKDEGSAMAKFAYYLDFLRKLLNTDLGRLVDNNVFEIRKYSNLGTNFYCINTSSKASALRNNKVSFDYNSFERLTHTPHDDAEYRIMLAHHSPRYPINYIWDRLGCEKDWETFVRQVMLISMTYGDAEEEKVQALKKIMDDMEKSESKIIKSHDFKLLETYCENPKQATTAEQWVKMFSEFYFAQKMSNIDIADYQTALQKSNADIHFDFALGGHIHDYKEGEENRNIAVLDAERFWYPDPDDKSATICAFSLLSLPKDSSVNPKYESYSFKFSRDSSRPDASYAEILKNNKKSTLTMGDKTLEVVRQEWKKNDTTTSTKEKTM